MIGTRGYAHPSSRAPQRSSGRGAYERRTAERVSQAPASAVLSSCFLVTDVANSPIAKDRKIVVHSRLILIREMDSENTLVLDTPRTESIAAVSQAPQPLTLVAWIRHG
jgi:hypothetical protein